MSLKMMVWAWEQELSLTDKLVLLSLADYANDDGECFPSMLTIARRTNASRRTIIRSIGRLELSGLIEITNRYINDKPTSNLYQIKFGQFQLFSNSDTMSLMTKSHHDSDRLSLDSDTESHDPTIDPTIDPIKQDAINPRQIIWTIGLNLLMKQDCKMNENKGRRLLVKAVKKFGEKTIAERIANAAFSEKIDLASWIMQNSKSEKNESLIELRRISGQLGILFSNDDDVEKLRQLIKQKKEENYQRMRAASDQKHFEEFGVPH